MPTRIEKIEDIKRNCNHPDHTPPMFIHIPAGHRMVHECPQCGKVTIVNG